MQTAIIQKMVHGAQYFFFIAGITNKTVTINRNGSECPVCGSSNISLKRDDMWFSFFFIPVFPIKRGAPYVVCHKCNGYADTSKQNTCSSCRNKFSDTYAYCPHCGAKNNEQ